MYETCRLLIQYLHTNASQDLHQSILVFLPGIAEIHELDDCIRGADSALAQQLWVLPLHSSIPRYVLHECCKRILIDFFSEEQAKAFQQPPAGKRKVLLSTNIAERYGIDLLLRLIWYSSITVPDIQFVIDFGLIKVCTAHYQQYLPAEINMLMSVIGAMSWSNDQFGKPTSCMGQQSVSWSGIFIVLSESWSHQQRSGRAGRVQKGHAYRLYDEAFSEQLSRFSDPEMARVPLENLVLRVMVNSFD